MTRGHNCQTDIAAMHVTKCQDYKAVAPCDDSVGMEIHDEKLIAEALGTFILVFFGCGSAVFTGADIGLMGIPLAFGLSIVAAAYALGHKSPRRNNHFVFASCREPVKTWALAARISGF